nr:hypothetical protein [Planosporangium flavigriseum]
MRYKTPPTSFLIRGALGIKGGSSRPALESAGVLTQEQLRKIAERKLPDLNAKDIEGAIKIVTGSARSMGVTIAD